MLFYSCRDDEDHNELFFEDVKEMRSFPEELIRTLADSLSEFISQVAEAKNSPRAAPGSESAEPPVKPETSPASTPVTVDRLDDIPWFLQVAIEHGLSIIGWYENNTSADIPPEHIWDDGEGLEQWWQRVAHAVKPLTGATQRYPKTTCPGMNWRPYSSSDARRC